MEVIIALLVIVIALFAYCLKRQLSYWQRRDIPHNKPVLLASLGEQHITKLLTDTYKQFKGSGPFCGFFLLILNCALILDIELVKNILIKDFNNFPDRGLYHNEINDPLTGNLFFLDGEKWRSLRNKLTPTFSSGKMRFMFPTVRRVAEELVAVVSAQLKMEPAVDNGKVLEVTDLTGRFTADVIGSCAFGIDCNCLRNPNAQFMAISERFFNERRHNKLIEGFIYSFPRAARLLGMRVIHQTVHDFFYGMVRDTLAYRERTNLRRNDFMDILIEMKNKRDASGAAAEESITENEVAAQAFIFFAAGYETSATTMGFILYELALHEDMQEKVREEINEVWSKTGGELRYESLKEMQYMDQVINETMRMHPIVPNLMRRTRARYETSDSKYYIEKNTICIIPTIAIHHDPAFYPEPEKFIPERFAPDEIQKRPACTFLPFGEGPRNCIGLRFGRMEMSIGLTYLLKHFKFTVAPETEVPFKLKKGFIVTTESGVFLRVQRV